MFGSTYPTFHASDIVSDRIRDPDFAAYVRWEYLPADRARVILAASRRGIADRRLHRAPMRTRIARRLRTWIRAARGTSRRTPSGRRRTFRALVDHHRGAPTGIALGRSPSRSELGRDLKARRSTGRPSRTARLVRGTRALGAPAQSGRRGPRPA